MAEGFVSEFWHDIDDVVTSAARDMFGTVSGGGTVDEVRWDGMSNAQLAAVVQQLNDGPGPSAVQAAADALSTIAGNLQQLDTTLRDQLQAIGINWSSQAAELAAEMTTQSSAYAAVAGAAGGANSAAVNAQGDAFAAARNAVPHPSTLQGPTRSTSFLNATGQLLASHGEDQAQQVAATRQARQQTVDAMTKYTSASRSGLANTAPPPPPPAVTVHPQPVDPGQITTVSGFAPPPPGSAPPGVAGGGTGGGPVPGGGATGVPGLPGVGTPGGAGASPVGTGAPGQQPIGPGIPGGAGGGQGTSGGTGGVPGLPGGGSGGVAGGAPVFGGNGSGSGPGTGGLGSGGLGGGGGNVGAPGTTPLAPGPVSGAGAGAETASGIAAQTATGAVSGSIVEDAAIGTAIVGGAVGAGVGGASARSDELVRGRQPGEPEPDDDYGDARSQAARALAELEGDEAAEAQVSARLAGVTEAAQPTLLEPLLGHRPDDDPTHADRYAADEDMFDDHRLVVPPVLGGDADNPR